MLDVHATSRGTSEAMRRVTDRAATLKSTTTSGRLRALLRGFVRREEGATAVEFALISVPFLGLLFMIFQTSLTFLMQESFKAAIDNAARQVFTGQAQNNAAITSWQNFRDQLVCPSTGTNLLPSFITCSNVQVDIRPYASFSGITRANTSQSFLWDGSGAQYNPGSPCQIIVVRAIYPMPIYMPMLMDPSLGSNVSAGTAGLTFYNGKYVRMVQAAAVFRNEPYTSSSGTPTGGCG